MNSKESIGRYLNKHLSTTVLYNLTKKICKQEKIINMHIQKLYYSKTEGQIFQESVKGINVFNKNNSVSATGLNEISQELKSCDCCQLTEAVFDNLSILTAIIIEKYPNSKEFIQTLRETKRLIEQFYLLHEITGREVIHSNNFIKHFDNHRFN